MHPAQIAVVRWLNDVVIGLNLCPFAARPNGEGRVRFSVSSAADEEALLEELENEMQLLDKTPAAEIETSLVILPTLLADFFDYTQFLTWADQRIKRGGWQGIYQIASFHPDYCFAGADESDDENLTNRAPFPILHLIREDSLSKALEYFPDVDEVPARNRARVEALTQEEKCRLFPYLFPR